MKDDLENINLEDIKKAAESEGEKKVPGLESVKKVAEKAAQAAQKLMSDKPPVPIELGGVADKLPKQGGSVVISPPPLSALPGGLALPKG